MTLQYENESGYDFGFDGEEVAKLVINAALDYEKFPYECEVSLSIVDSEEIHRLNNEFRQIDRSTDVLSFPLIDYKEAGNYDDIEFSDFNINPETDEIMLGDIVLCKEKIISQAEEYGHSVKREYSFLIAHSMLHLLGYDHMNDDERVVMEDKQEAILDSINITRNTKE